MKNLDRVCVFNGIKYYGRIVHNKFDCDSTFENLVMFEEALGDALSPFYCGEKECDEDTWKRIHDIDDNVWCYVPKDVLQRSDEEVIKWCEEHSIDV